MFPLSMNSSEALTSCRRKSLGRGRIFSPGLAAHSPGLTVATFFPCNSSYVSLYQTHLYSLIYSHMYAVLKYKTLCTPIHRRNLL